MHRTARPALVLLAALALLTACTGADPAPAPTPSATIAPGPTAEDVVLTRTIPGGGTDIDVAIHPVVRVGDHAVLTLDLTSAAAVEPEGLYTGYLFEVDSFVGGYDPMAIRLFDLAADEVYEVATDADQRPVATPGDASTLPAGGTRLQIAYAAPPADVDHLGLYLPGTGFIDAIPVIDDDVPVPTAGPSPVADAEVLDLSTVVQARTLPLQSFSRELGGAVSTDASTQKVEITLGSDVLFAIDSADLTPDAEAAIAVAAQQLAERDPGTVDVVGHTDDVDDDAHNEDLSERRAAAVVGALAARIDTASYPLQPSGRGETEPLLPNTTDENRALNRRVTLTLTSEVTASATVETTGELPPFDDGPVATGVEGVTVDASRPYRVTAPEARVVDGHLVVDVAVTALDDAIDPSFGPSFLSAVFSYRGSETLTPDHTTAGVVVVVGGTALYPLDYQIKESPSFSGGVWWPATELATLTRLDGGQTRVMSNIYPRLVPTDTVTVQVTGTGGSQAFRLTDIPVVEG